MQKIYKFTVLVLFLIGGALFLFNNFVTNYNQEISRTKLKIDGVEFAQGIQKFILKLQKLRGYGQFTKETTSQADWNSVRNSIEAIKSDVRKDLTAIKLFEKKYPLLYDIEYSHILKEVDNILEDANQDGDIVYQRYTYVIEQLKEKMYYLGFKSKLLLEADSDKHFFVETMLKHLPNLIEITGKIRAKTTKAILNNSTDPELKYSVQNSCTLCQEQIEQIYKVLNQVGSDTEKTRLLTLLSAANDEIKKMKDYVKKIVLTDTIDVDALEFFTVSTNTIDKIFEFYSADAGYLTQKLNYKLEELEKTKLYGTLVGILVVLFIIATIISMIRSYILYARTEDKIKNNLTSIIELKNNLEKCTTINEISSSSLHFFATKFNMVQGVIYLFNEENNKLYLAASYATNDMKAIIELGEGLIGEIAIQKQQMVTHVEDGKEKKFKLQSIAIEPSTIFTVPMVSYDNLFGVLQLGFIRKDEIANQDDFAYFIDMIMGFLRDAKHLEISKKYIELIDKYVITSKTNTKGVITDVSDAFTKISGYSKEEIIGKSHSIVSHPDTPTQVHKDLWDTILSGNSWSGEIKNLNKNGKEYWIESTITPLMDKYGNILGFSAIIHDITDKKRIEEYSITDVLTSLYNRRFFNTTFDKELKISKREDKKLVLIMIDIDYFKQYNDTYGHQKGDEVLKAVAQTMKEHFKRANDYVFRLGGEEFAISFYTDSLETAIKRAELLRRNIEELKLEHISSKISNHITISMGVSMISKECKMEMDEIYRFTDESLYKAKNKGRNRVEVSSISL